MPSMPRLQFSNRTFFTGNREHFDSSTSVTPPIPSLSQETLSDLSTRPKGKEWLGKYWKWVVIYAGTFTLAIPTMFLGQCVSPDYLADNYIANQVAAGNLKPDANGVITVTYGAIGADGKATGTEPAGAITEGFSAWNDYTSVTHIQFVQAAAGTSPTILLDQVSSDCIYSKPRVGEILYDSTWLSRSNSNNMSTIMIAHEVGHILGLDDKPPGTVPASIMNQGTGDCQTGGSNATEITDTDADDADGCEHKSSEICARCGT